MRFLVETLAGIVGGLVSWAVVGVAAALLLSIGGDREGARGMAGIFVIGPMGGPVGFALCFWLARRYLERGTPAASHGLGAMLLSFAIVIGLGFAAVTILSAVFQPQAPHDLEPGQKAGFEFRINVPEHLLKGKPVSDLVALEFKKYGEPGEEVVTRVPWTETRSMGRVTLTGRVELGKQTHEQYFVLHKGSESFDFFARIPADMRKAGAWEDEIYVGRDPALPMSERVSITFRYAPARP